MSSSPEWRGPGKAVYDVYRDEHRKVGKRNGHSAGPRWKDLKPGQMKLWNDVAKRLWPTQQPATVAIAAGDDWQGLYVDDRLYLEGHRLDLLQVLRVLNGRRIMSAQRFEVDQAWLEALGSLPASLTDVRRYKP